MSEPQPPKRGKTVSAGSAARLLVEGLDKKGNLERAKAVSAWREIAGPDVAVHARGSAMRGAELVIYVDSPVWATELSAMSEHYRTALNTVLGKELVGSIRFTVSRGAGDAEPAPDPRDARLVPPAPLTEHEKARIDEMAASIHSEAVREAVVKAAEASLGWRKGIGKTPRAGQRTGAGDSPGRGARTGPEQA